MLLASVPRESGAFALAGISNHDGGTDILIRRFIRVPEELCPVREAWRLELAPRAINGLAALCERNGLTAILCHCHPTDSPYSPSDDHGERRVFEAIRPFLPPGVPMGSLLISPSSTRSRVWLPDTHQPTEPAEIVVIGRNMRRLFLTGHLPCVSNAVVHDRQVRAFGVDGQRLISWTKVGIIGAGGTGSPIAEQIARLGVKDIVLVDPDFLEPSNISRVYGTFARDTRRRWFGPKRRRKVDLIARHLKRIQPSIRISTVAKHVACSHAAYSLRDCDVLFLCTDDHWGRSVVNQLSYQYLIPTINLGTAITSEGGRISHAVGIVDVLRPGLPCLWCKQFLNSSRIAMESMPLKDREDRRREGYVQGVDGQAPSVVSLNTTLAGIAVNVFLQLVTGFMGDQGNISRLNYDFLGSTLRRGSTALAEKCICRQALGFGDLKPLPVVEEQQIPS